MARFAVYDDVVAEVRDEIARSVDLALAAGVPADRIAVDPGLGFAKQAAHDWELLARLDRIVDLGLPVLVGASRKSFLAPVTSGPTARDGATAAVSVAVALAGGWGVRVHDVRASLDAVQVVAAMRAAAPSLAPAPMPGAMAAQSLDSWSLAEVVETNLGWLGQARPLIAVPIKLGKPGR